MRKTTINAKHKLALALASALSLTAGSAYAADTTAKVYGSLRIGVSAVSADTGEMYEDGANGTDHLSRVGIKGSTKLDGSLTAIGMVEYGLADADQAEPLQKASPTLRQAWVGLKGDWGTIMFGSQTNIWHKFVRSGYFSSLGDSLRQGAIRDDDLLQYYFSKGKLKLAAGIQIEGNDGDDIDQLQAAVEYSWDTVKLQAAISKDNRGDSTGNLIGLRGYWTPTKEITLSAFTHMADEDYDFYAGGSAGDIFLVDEATDRKVSLLKTCKNEERETHGVYGSYKLGKHSISARYATNSCDMMGDADSVRVEYVHAFGKQFRTWVGFETISMDDTRMPDYLTEDSIDELQLGIRYDF